MPRNGRNMKVVMASVRCDGYAERAEDDAAQALEVAIVKRRLYAIGFFTGNLYRDINAALKAGKISKDRAARWHEIRILDNLRKHDPDLLAWEWMGGSGGGGGGGGGGSGRRRRRRRR